MRLLLQLDFNLLVGAGRVGDVKSAFVVEVGRDGPIHQRRSGGQLDREAFGQREGVAVELDLVRGRLRGRVGTASGQADKGKEERGNGEVTHDETLGGVGSRLTVLRSQCGTASWRSQVPLDARPEFT